MTDIFGHRRRWYVEKWIQYRQYWGRGEIFFGEIEGLIVTGGMGAALLLYLEKVTGYLLPLKIGIIIVLVLKIVKTFIGWLDRHYIKSWQIEAEWTVRKGISRWATEQMEMLREIHKKECPDSKVRHEGFVKEDK